MRYTISMTQRGSAMFTFILVVAIIMAIVGGYYLYDFGFFHASETFGFVPFTTIFGGIFPYRYCIKNESSLTLENKPLYRIDFGDGKKSAGIDKCKTFSLSHTYATEDTYKVSLIIETPQKDSPKVQILHQVRIQVSN